MDGLRNAGVALSVATLVVPMRELLSRDWVGVEAADELAARVQLRAQVGRLERELGTLVGEGFGRVTIEAGVGSAEPAPRVLDLGELERLRDELVERIAAGRAALTERAAYEEGNRSRLRALLATPEEFPGLAITRAEIGEPGCGGWRSAPRFGPLGRLMDWWRVKVSSGCPLAGRLTAVEQEAQARGAATT
jgi:hypothetical protein